ncbi:MAG: class II glutamine amidotransferase [Loktanella sp.]|jgi:glutamine amidotransferase|nr:class II glutamine amidotransferase [Loktanella sp.]MDO7607695.1 class II glutamine amidotransferase [Loktanella sp.]MDO7622769.1 class II glutamine amidotransferase [Loktanella sp.]MDO7626356.1 class II glutamine amidotransferase [Loktanella sp.]MDO7664615.1 class II glutamine amidotransferase [Loktanella sp.]
MCRIAAYTGPAIPLENIVVRPAHSLLTQSQHANEAKLAVNGDGFGIAWYGDDTRPGLYRDVLPSWADGNLLSLCRMMRSSQFIAHVRAGTVGETSRANCHPFTYDNWSFCHNGQIPHFASIRRRMEAALPDNLFASRRGTTDSEMIFLTLLANGLDNNPSEAMRTTLDIIGPATDQGPIRLTTVFSNGSSLFAFRYASDGCCPTLYLSGVLDNGGRSLASEPLCGDASKWTTVPTDCIFEVDERGDTQAGLMLAA